MVIIGQFLSDFCQILLNFFFVNSGKFLSNSFKFVGYYANLSKFFQGIWASRHLGVATAVTLVITCAVDIGHRLAVIVHRPLDIVDIVDTRHRPIVIVVGRFAGGSGCFRQGFTGIPGKNAIS